MKTSELTGAALDWAVAHALNNGAGEHYLKSWIAGGDKRFVHCEVIMSYSTNWGEAGPIIEREIYELLRCRSGTNGPVYFEAIIGFEDNDAEYFLADGPTALIAAMRCFVASKLGDEVDVPKELA